MNGEHVSMAQTDIAETRPEAAPQAKGRAGGWKSAGIALLFLGVYFFVQFAVMTAYMLFIALRAALAGGAGDISALMGRVYAEALAQSELVTGVIDLLSMGAFMLVCAALRRPFAAEAGFRRVRIARLLPLVPLGVLLNVLLTSLVSLLPASVLAPYIEASGQALLGRYGLLSVLILTVLAPLVEETLFRGLIYGNLRRALPAWLAVLLSSAVFGLMHGQSLWIMYTALLGVLFAVVYNRYGSLWASVLLHMSFNAGSYLVQCLQGVPLGVALSVSGAGTLICLYAAFGRRIPGLRDA